MIMVSCDSNSQHRIPLASYKQQGKNRGEACVSDGRASEQLAAHLRARSRQLVGWRYRRGPSYHLQSLDPQETPCGADEGEEAGRYPFDTIFGNWGDGGESIERGVCGSQSPRGGLSWWISNI